MEHLGKARVSDETFDEFLASEGLLAVCEEDAIKEIIADQIRAAMAEQHLTKTAMAARMKTDRRQLDRLLDPANPSVTLATLRRAAAAVGRCNFTWEAFATLATGFAAVGAAVYIGRKQTEIQKRQAGIQAQSLRSDLFDRRYRVFDRTQELILEVFKSDIRFDDDALRPFKTAMGEAGFLFDESVVRGLDEILEKFLKYRVLMKSQNDSYFSEQEADIQLWFSQRLRSLPELFKAMELGE
jgi:antitoxin HicB